MWDRREKGGRLIVFPLPGVPWVLVALQLIGEDLL